MNHWRLVLYRACWQVIRALRFARLRLGWAALLGGLTVVLAILLAVWSLQMTSQVQELRARADLARKNASLRVPPPTAAQRLQAFHDALPAAADIPQTIAQLIQLADTHRLLLESGDYRASPDLAGRYLRYRIVLPVQGDARAIQAFMLAALREHRALALESVTFKRERIEAREVEARIQFALITRLAEQAGSLSPRAHGSRDVEGG